MCDACEEPTCQYREPLCCSERPETLAELTAYEKEEQLVREQEQARQEAEKREKEVADAQVLRAVMSRLQSAKVRRKALLPAVIPRRSGSQKEVKINDNDNDNHSSVHVVQKCILRV